MSNYDAYQKQLKVIIDDIGLKKFNEIVNEMSIIGINAKRQTCNHRFIASPICGDPMYCPKCGKEKLSNEL